jgi:putative restriction endonuclease
MAFLSKIHHAAFDANLIGVDSDFRIHVAGDILALNDGPMLEHALKALAGRTLRLPLRSADYPDRDRLTQRFSEFLARA